MAVWVGLCSHSALAQSWVDSLFPERTYDFGTVARGSKVRHSFRLVNRTNDEIHIATWRTKCGCTEVNVGARSIPPATQTTIDALIDTTKFNGPKASGLTLVLDRPSYVEVDLNLNCFIRGDLTLSPGQVDFGAVQRASHPNVTLYLTYSGGQPNWGVVEMQTRSDHITAKLVNMGRTYAGGTQYSLTTTLKPSIATGFFRDEITLKTNDPSSPTIPISVTANVQSAVTVSPSILDLGRINAGAVVTQRVVVRSSRPFKVTALKATKDELSAPTDDAESRPLHIVNLKFKAPSQPGPFNAVVEISTDLKDEPPAKLQTFATIVPAPPVGNGPVTSSVR
jgi:hypothetical protein